MEIEKLQLVIASLIENGECLEDAAQTCGHDEELADWKAAVKAAKKTLDYKKVKAKYNKQQKEMLSQQYEAKRKKAQADEEEKKKKDADFLSSLGVEMVNGQIKDKT